MKALRLLMMGAVVWLACLVFMVHADSLSTGIGSDVLAGNYGGRNGLTLTNVIGLVSNRPCRVIIDGGDWDSTNNVTFPTNITLHIARGSRIRMTNGTVLTINGGFEAGFYETFAGLGSPSGTATGQASFLYRISEWGDLNTYNIGTGRLGYVAVSNNNLTLFSGLTGSFDRLIVQDWIHGYSGTGDFYQANATNLLVRKTAVVTTLIATNQDGSSEELSPLWGTNIYFSTATGWDEIRRQIAALPRYIPRGNRCTINLAPGTYTWATTNQYGAWDLSYFYGGGDLHIQSSNSADHVASTSKTCIIDVQAMSISNRAMIFNRDSVDVHVTGIQFLMDYTNVTSGGSTEQERAPVAFYLSNRAYMQDCSIIGNTTSVVANANGFGVIMYGGGGFMNVSDTTFSRTGFGAIGALSGATVNSSSNTTFGGVTSPCGLFASGSLIYMGNSQPGGAVAANSNTTANGGYIR